VHSSQKALAQICRDYYSNLYSARTPTSTLLGVGTQALHVLRNKTLASHKTKLQAPIQLSELYATLMDMKTGKSSGLDGIVLEFYNCFWDLIGEDYLQMIIKSIHVRRLLACVMHGMIALLYKGRFRQALTNWRSITLLNLGYKIYTKALQMRLQHVLIGIIILD
jgi:hypothetical protein